MAKLCSHFPLHIHSFTFSIGEITSINVSSMTVEGYIQNSIGTKKAMLKPYWGYRLHRANDTWPAQTHTHTHIFFFVSGGDLTQGPLSYIPSPLYLILRHTLAKLPRLELKSQSPDLSYPLPRSCWCSSAVAPCLATRPVSSKNRCFQVNKKWEKQNSHITEKNKRRGWCSLMRW